MCGVTKDANRDMEEGDREGSTSDVEMSKMLLINLNGEYMDKFHKVMQKFDKLTISETICKMVDNELKVSAVLRSCLLASSCPLLK